MEEENNISAELAGHLFNAKALKKTTKAIKKQNKKIKNKFVELEEVEISLYYSEFSTEDKRQIDLKEIQTELKLLISVKVGLLDTLLQQVNLIKMDLSNCGKVLALTTNK